jgi:hypothetical protein
MEGIGMVRLQMLGTLATVALVVGCNTGSTPNPAPAGPTAAASKYFLTDEPASPKSVSEAKESAKDGEEVTLVGRIGGSVSPFVSGRASFTIVDTSFVPCSEIEGDSCNTPWDYCCDSDRLPGSTAVVKVVDADGKTLAMDAKKELGMAELQTVVVKGKAKRDEAGNLTVLTPALFVRR